MTNEPQADRDPEPTVADAPAAHGPRGCPKAARTAVTIGVMIAVLLVVFIAQNTGQVEISFLAWDGDVSLAVSLLIAAVYGAAVVLQVGTIRVAQLRRAERRRRRQLKNRARHRSAADRWSSCVSTLDRRPPLLGPR
jgi:uncharacterized integral membrane protein